MFCFLQSPKAFSQPLSLPIPQPARASPGLSLVPWARGDTRRGHRAGCGALSLQHCTPGWGTALHGTHCPWDCHKPPRGLKTNSLTAGRCANLFPQPGNSFKEQQSLGEMMAERQWPFLSHMAARSLPRETPHSSSGLTFIDTLHRLKYFSKAVLIFFAVQ